MHETAVRIPDERVIEVMREIVAEKGADYVYPDEERFDYGDVQGTGTCRYALDDGTPSCIVGHVVARLGGTPDPYTTLGAHVVAQELGLSENAGYALREAQFEQDNGAAWGFALEMFEERIGTDHA